MTGRYRERAPGVWQITLELGADPVTGKRLQKFATVKGTEAKVKKELRRRLADAEAGNLVREEVTVARFLALWLEKHAERRCRPKTLETYREFITNHIAPQLGRLKLVNLSTLNLEDYYADRQERGRKDGKGGLSAQTVLHHHRLLHKAFEDARKWGYLTQNPAELATAPTPEVKDPVVLTTEQTLTLIRAAEGTRYYLPILLAVFMAMRRGEVLGLRWQNIDWAKKRLRVTEAYIRLAKGDEFGPTKTHRSKRPVSLPDFLIDALLEEKAAQEQRKRDFPHSYEEHDLVVCHADGTPWPPNPFSHCFSDWIVKQPVPRVTFHQLRHSHISQMVEAGENIRVIAARAGHSRASFTMDRYVHVLAGADEGLAERLNERIRAGLKSGGSTPPSGGENGRNGVGEPASESHFAGQMEAGWRQTTKTAPDGGRKIVRIYARKERRGRDSNPR